MDTATQLKIAYTLLPPPISALPAKYSAPLSLGVHSLSTGYISYRLAELAEFDDEAELALLLGMVHDIHQKLISNGLSSLKKAKKYLRSKLDELGYTEYVKYIEDALEQDTCGKENPVRGLPRELATICHIADMTQGRLEGYSLLYWLRNKVKTVSKELTVRFYSIMIPQPFARAYAMLRIYSKYIADTQHLALASPWGLYVITYEDELEESLEVGWDALRLDTALIDYRKIVDMEKNVKVDVSKISISKDELKNRLWSRFAKMFYQKNLLEGDEPLYPKLPTDVRGLFVNIEFTDIKLVELKELKPEEIFICGLCGMPHHKDDSLPISMYGTKQGVKIAGVRVTPEKWNRFLPAHIKVKTWDGRGPWKHGIGMCPLCTLDAVAVRELGFKVINGFISVSISKPIPVELLKMIGQTLRDRKLLKEEYLVPTGTFDSIVLDYNTATVATSLNIPEPKTENMFDGGELTYIGQLLSLGLYPLKFLPGLDISIPDRMLTTPVTFQALNFPVTSRDYGPFTPWVAELVRVAGLQKRSVGMELLMDRPEHAPLHLLALDKPTYDRVSSLLREVGVRV